MVNRPASPLQRLGHAAVPVAGELQHDLLDLRPQGHVPLLVRRWGRLHCRCGPRRDALLGVLLAPLTQGRKVDPMLAANLSRSLGSRKQLLHDRLLELRTVALRTHISRSSPVSSAYQAV